jgi:predicted nucleic acid-binding protein
MRLVLDASALVRYLSDASSSIDGLVDAENDLAVPTLCDAEVVGGLAHLVGRGLLDEADATDALVDYVSLPVERHHHLAHIGRMWQLRTNFTAADAAYVALAEALEATLVTRDERLARAVERHTGVPVLP